MYNETCMYENLTCTSDASEAIKVQVAFKIERYGNFKYKRSLPGQTAVKELSDAHFICQLKP